jgi:hypothetical protein
LSRAARCQILTLFVLACAAEARADWLLTPFVGTSFAGQSALVQFDPDAVATRHWLFGGSVAWLGDGVFGAEADFAFVPGIFEDDNSANLITASSAITLSGNAIATLPLSITRESLRPYLIGGFGLMRARAEDQICLACEALNEPALQIGGGALGLLSDRAGLRFDIRQIRTVRREETLIGERQAKLSFWRLTVGVVIRY